MRRALALLAAGAVGLAAWLSFGLLAVTTAAPASPRVGLLAPPWMLGLLLGAAALVAFVVRPAWPRLAPLFLGLLLVLPWLPVAVPPAFLIWTGPVALAVWLAVGVGLVASFDLRRLPDRLRRLVADPTRAPMTAGGVALVVFALAAWQVSPSVPDGDEPHYLIITQSLLTDGDLQIENNHRRGDYEAYSAEYLKPDYRQRGSNGEIYSIHAPGLPLVIAPAFALGGYPGVVVFLIMVSAAGTVLLWKVAYRVSRSVAAAWFGWTAVALSPPFIFHTFSVFPDGLGGLLVLAGVWALLRAGDHEGVAAPSWIWFATGAALALLPWLHTRFVMLAGVLGLLIVGRLDWRGAPRRALGATATLLSLPALSAAAWFTFFFVIYGTPDPRAPYGGDPGGQLAYVPSGLGGLLLDQQFGLLPHAPVLLFAVVGLVVLLRSRSTRRLAAELLLVLVPYLVVVTTVRMWWAGWSAPARFVVPVLAPLALPAAEAWRTARSGATRATAFGALLATLFVTSVLVCVDGGRLAYDVRDGYALWLGWLNRLVDLPRGLPSFFRVPAGLAFEQGLVWILCLAGGWVVLRALEEHGVRGRRALALAAPACLAAAAMVALTAVWRLSHASGVLPAPAQLEMLRAASRPSPGVGVGYAPLQRLTPHEVVTRLEIESPPRYLQGDDGPLLVLFGVPAGAYRVRLEGSSAPQGTIHVTVGSGAMPIRELSLPGVEMPALESTTREFTVNLPVAVNSVVVRGNDAARRTVERAVLQPVGMLPESRTRRGTSARGGLGFPGATVFFLDDHASAEPTAFWVGGGRATDVLVQPARPAARQVELFVRNAPVPNRLTLEGEGWRQDVPLAPGEERILTVPVDRARAATFVRLTSASGFTPSRVDPSTTDSRFLGVWVQLR